jgi:hypothetical protein
MLICIEHKGVSNRMLRELGWIRVIRGHRDSPRNSEITLEAQEVLLRRHRELSSHRNNAVSFVGLVFCSHDHIWVERCASIIKEV